MVNQTQRRNSWSVRRECWQTQLRLMAGQNGSESFAPKLRWNLLALQALLQGKHKKAVFEKQKEWYWGSSSSSRGCCGLQTDLL